MSWKGLVTPVGKKNTYGVLVGDPEGNRKLTILYRKWYDNIKTDLQQREWKDLGWINLAQISNK
jgi:hypothetical protein